MISEKLKIAIDRAKDLDKRTDKLQKEINELMSTYACKQPKTQASVDRLKGVNL